MNLWSKSFILIALIMGIAVQGSQVENKEDAAQIAINDELLNAVRVGATDRVRTLLLEKANPNYQVGSITLLLIAIELCHVGIVELLLCQGADANQGLANTPLVTAIKCMDRCIIDKMVDRAELYVHIVDLLLYHGADPNKRNSIIQYRAFNKCLQYIYIHSNEDFSPFSKALELLLEYGADDTASYSQYETVHDLAEKNPELQRILKDHATRAKKEIAATWCGLPMAVVQLCADKLHVTDDDRALYKAVGDGKVKKVAALLKKNADPCIAINKQSALEVSLMDYTVPATKLLLQHKANPNVNVYLANGRCIKPLERICLLANIRSQGKDPKFLGCVELLLEHGGNVNAYTMPGDSYIIDAAKCNLPDLVRLYLKHGANPELVNIYGKSLRDYASAEVLQACEEHSQHCRERVTQAVPQLTHAQDFRDQETDLTARIAEYI